MGTCAEAGAGVGVAIELTKPMGGVAWVEVAIELTKPMGGVARLGCCCEPEMPLVATVMSKVAGVVID